MTLAARRVTVRTRTHEAGHAVVGRASGQVPESVVVFGDHGYTRSLPRIDLLPRTLSAADERACVEARAVYGLAGEAALEVFGDPNPRVGAESDRARALEAVRLVDAVPLATAATLATLARLYSEALRLARQHRAALERFVETLEANHDRLAGYELTVALDAAFGGWPTPRFDAKSESRIVTRQRALFEAAVRHTDSIVERRKLMNDCEAAARTGRSLDEHRRTGLYAPSLKGTRA